MEWSTGNTITVLLGLVSIGGQIAAFAYFIGKLKSVQEAHEDRMDKSDERLDKCEVEFHQHRDNDSKHANKERDAEFEKRIEDKFNRLEQSISQNFQITQSLIEGLKPRTRTTK